MQTIAGKLVAIIAVLVWPLVLVMPSHAQTNPGYNAICKSLSGCAPVATPAFIDASVLGNNRTDLCAVLYNILTGFSTTYPAAGAVIDARGFPGTLGTSMVCAGTIRGRAQ